MTDSPMGALVRKFRPELMDNPMVVSIVDEYGANLSPDDAAKLQVALPGLIESVELCDYPAFKSGMDACGWGSMAPVLFAMVQDFKENE